MTVKVVNKSKHNLPEYATPGSAGMDLKADLDAPITLRSLERAIIPTGLYLEIPEGYAINIQPRSGLAAKEGVICALGLIDSDYRGQIGVILMNLSDKPYMVHPGERVGQAVLRKVERIEWEEVAELSSTERGEGGFGSSGK